MTPISITHYTLTSALGHGKAATHAALLQGRSGLRANDFADAPLTPSSVAWTAWKTSLNLLYRKPVVSAADVEIALSISTPTANTLIRDFERMGILKEITGQLRGRAYSFEPYLSLFVS